MSYLLLRRYGIGGRKLTPEEEAIQGFVMMVFLILAAIFGIWYWLSWPDPIDLIGKPVVVKHGKLKYEIWDISVDINSIDGFNHSLATRVERRRSDPNLRDACILATRYQVTGILDGDIIIEPDGDRTVTNLRLLNPRYYVYGDWFNLDKSHKHCREAEDSEPVPYLGR